MPESDSGRALNVDDLRADTCLIPGIKNHTHVIPAMPVRDNDPERARPDSSSNMASIMECIEWQ